MAIGELNNEIRETQGRGFSHDRKGAAEKRMSAVSDGDVMTNLINHYGIIIGVIFYRWLAPRSTTTWSSGP